MGLRKQNALSALTEPRLGVGNEEMSAFAERLYTFLKQVPPGRVVTYKALALAAGCGSPRAVGQALKRNPYAPHVPCHRVIRSDLRIGGYQGMTAGRSVHRKRKLLQQEGVLFIKDRLADETRIYDFNRNG